MLADSPPAPLRDGVTTSGLPVSRLGDYELMAELGRGGMGVVFRARQTSLDRIVAIKLMHRALSEDRAHAARFLREARVAASLRYPGIVAIYDLGRLDGVPFFTMELVEGSSLESLLADGPVAPARVAELGMIATSSRRTCCSTSMAGRSSPTSVSPRICPPARRGGRRSRGS